MCRNIWTSQIKNEVLSAFGRDYLFPATEIPEMVITPGTFEKHKPLYTIKLSEFISPALIKSFDERVKEMIKTHKDYHYIEGASLGDFFFNVMLSFNDSFTSSTDEKRTLYVSISIEARADMEDPLSIVGEYSPEYALLYESIPVSKAYEAKERSRMVREAETNIERYLSVDYIEFSLREIIENLSIDMATALEMMVEEI